MESIYTYKEKSKCMAGSRADITKQFVRFAVLKRRYAINAPATENNSFKPNLLHYTKAMADKACHGFGPTTQVGLTQASSLGEFL